MTMAGIVAGRDTEALCGSPRACRVGPGPVRKSTTGGIAGPACARLPEIL